MIIDSRSQAVRNLYDNVVTIDGDDAFDKDHKKITLDEDAIDTEIKRIEKEYSDNQYQRDRLYPELGQQLDMLFHDMTAGKGDQTGEWYKAISKVKSDHPKP